MRERYGAEYAMQVPSLKQKAADTNLKRYGYPNPAQGLEARLKISAWFHSLQNQKTGLFQNSESLMYTRTCVVCGKQFQTKKPNQKVCSDKHFRKCAVCGKEFELKRDSLKTQTCSRQCLKTYMSRQTNTDEVKKKRQETSLKKYGTKSPSQSREVRDKIRKSQLSKSKSQVKEIALKRAQTNVERYGVKNTFQSAEKKQKAKETLQAKYGVDNISQNEDVKRKKAQTSLKHYGVTNPMKSSQVRAKAYQTNLSKYGVEESISSTEVQDKIKKSTQESLGVDYPFQSPKVQEKARITFNKKYGGNSPSADKNVVKKQHDTVVKNHGGYTLEVPDLKAQYEKTCLERYGYAHPMKNKDLLEKRKEHTLEKYGVEYTTQLQSTKDKTRQTMNEKYGVDWPCQLPQAIEASGNIISKPNRKIAEFIQSLGYETEFEFILSNRSYDIHVLNTNVLIEIDPTYTHNCLGKNVWHTVRDKNYHKDKTKFAESRGYRCVHIFDWEDARQVLKSSLPSTKTVYARKCKAVEIDSNTAKQFEDLYHIQGKVNGQRVCLGLYYQGELVELMTFGKPRYSRKFEWELLRLCTKSSLSVTGGASKLFGYFVKTYHPKSLISYCDYSKFNGSVYEKLGMKLDHFSVPNKIWSKGDEYVTNNLLLSRGFDQLFDAHYGKGTDNEKLMEDAGWLPVYDCGQKVFTWNCEDD